MPRWSQQALRLGARRRRHLAAKPTAIESMHIRSGAECRLPDCGCSPFGGYNLCRNKCEMIVLKIVASFAKLCQCVGVGTFFL